MIDIKKGIEMLPFIFFFLGGGGRVCFKCHLDDNNFSKLKK